MGMAQQFLDGSDVIAVLQQVGGKAMPQGMDRSKLADTRRADRIVNLPLQHRRVHVPEGVFSGPGILVHPAGRKKPVPGPFKLRGGVF